MRRTLILDEDDLIMVVKEDVVKQIDEHRGELNRTEFVNHLIHCQLKQYQENHDYVTREELRRCMQEITGLLQNFLQFFISYGMAMGQRAPDSDLQALSQQLDSFNKPETDEETQEL